MAISILFVFLLFLLSYLYRQNRDDDIQTHSLYTIGKVVKFSKTLKSGDYWDYEFEYNGLYFKGSKPSHVDYDVKLGDQFLVNFSSKNTSKNKILY